MKICLLISILKSFIFKTSKIMVKPLYFQIKGAIAMQNYYYISQPLWGGGADRNCPLKVNPHSNCLWIYGSCTVTVYFNSHFHCYFCFQTQMANWNRTIAYINFALLMFLLLLIVLVVAFLSTNLSQNNPASFMNPMA